MADAPQAAAARPETAPADAAPAASSGSTSLFRWAVLCTIALLAATSGAALLIAPTPWYPDSLVFLTLFCARHQDLPVAAALCLILAMLILRPASVQLRPRSPLPGLVTVTGLAGLVALIWWIRVSVLFDHDFTRDEHMAIFDARIFGSGRLAWPVRPDMRPIFSALNDLFLHPVGDREAWVSAYLPVNAGLRGLLGHVIPLSLVSPLLVGIGGLALWTVARRLWPQDGWTQAVTLGGYATSSQVLLTGTAAFAMTTHLAFNLVWLALFLRNTRAGHVGALVTGLLATGIHQPIFHPLFVLPFLDLLRRQRRWRLLINYVVAYGAIGLLWLAWPHLIDAQATALPPATAQQFGFLARLADVLTPPNFAALWLMSANLLRFITWQHALLLPLALIGLKTGLAPRPDTEPADQEADARADLIRALALGVPMLLIAMTILLPPQGHGWGYRYLHGLIGNLCLLAGFGWHWLARNGGAPLRALWWTTAFAVLVTLPLHTAMVRQMIAPYALAARAFARVDADYLVVDTESLPFGTNFVVNRPDLANRPRLLLGSLLYPPDLARLCPGHTIAFADAPLFAATYRYYEDPPPIAPSRLQTLQKRVAARAGCRVIAAPAN